MAKSYNQGPVPPTPYPGDFWWFQSTKAPISKHRDLIPLQLILANLLEVIVIGVELSVGRQKWVCFAHIYADIHVHT